VEGLFIAGFPPRPLSVPLLPQIDASRFFFPKIQIFFSFEVSQDFPCLGSPSFRLIDSLPPSRRKTFESFQNLSVGPTRRDSSSFPLPAARVLFFLLNSTDVPLLFLSSGLFLAMTYGKVSDSFSLNGTRLFFLAPQDALGSLPGLDCRLRWKTARLFFFFSSKKTMTLLFSSSNKRFPFAEPLLQFPHLSPLFFPPR